MADTREQRRAAVEAHRSSTQPSVQTATAGRTTDTREQRRAAVEAHRSGTAATGDRLVRNNVGGFTLLRQRLQETPQARSWYGNLSNIINYANSEEDDYDQTMSFLDIAKKDLQQIQEESAGGSRTVSDMNWYKGMEDSYTKVIGYLTDRSNQENSRSYARNTEALEAAQARRNELDDRIAQLRSDRLPLGAEKSQRVNDLDHAIWDLEQQQKQQDSVIEQLQKQLDGWKPNTNERREELIELVRTPTRNLPGETDEERTANREKYVQELRELDQQLYNPARDYTGQDRLSSVLNVIGTATGKAVTNAAGTAIAGLSESAKYRQRNPDVGFLGSRTGTGAEQAEQDRIAAANGVLPEKSNSTAIQEARDELTRLQTQLSQVDFRYGDLRPGEQTQRATDYAREKSELNQRIAAQEETIAQLEEEDRQLQTARDELQSLQEQYGQLQTEREQYRDGSGDAVRLDRKISSLEDQINRKQSEITEMEAPLPEPEAPQVDNGMDQVAQNLQDLADQLGEVSARDYQRAVSGTSAAGKFAIDATINLVQMGVDIAVGTVTGTSPLLPMFVRTFGDAAQEARLSGATLDDQIKFGLAKGTIEVATEKIFDGLAGAFGKGAADDFIEDLIEELTSTRMGQNFMRAVAGSVGEGTEEILSDFFGTFADMLVNDESLAEAWKNNMAGATYDFILGATMGSLGGVLGTVGDVTGLPIGDYAEKNEAMEFNREIWREGANPKVLQEVVNREAEGQQGPLTKEQQSAWQAGQRVLQQRQDDSTQQATKAAQEAIRERSNLSGTADLTNVSVGYQGKAIKFNGFTKDGDKTVAILELPSGTEFHVDPKQVDYGSGTTGQFLKELSTQQHPEVMAIMYEPGQDVGSFINEWNIAERVYGRLSTNTTASAVQRAPELRNLTPAQINAAFSIGRSEQAEAMARTAVPEGTDVKKLKPGEGKISYNGATIDGTSYAAVDLTSLNETQQAQINVIETLARVTGVNFVMYQSGINEAGQYTGANGVYKDGTVYLDVNAGLNAQTQDGRTMGEIAIVRTAAHELTHFIQDFNASQYETLRSFIVDTLLESGDYLGEQGVQGETAQEKFDALVARKMNRERDRKMSYEEAVDEVIADGCEMMLRNSRAVERLAAEQPGIANRIRRWIKSWVKKIQAAFQGVDAQHAEARAVMQRAEQLQQLWDEAFENAARIASNRAKENTAGTEAGGTRYSFAGERARTADAEALNRARELEAQGKGNETIRQQTGWFRGMDGKWRFEIDDSEAEYSRTGDLEFRKDHPEYAEFRELLGRFGDLSEEEMNRLRELHDTWNGEIARLQKRLENGSVPLNQVLDHEALFRAYPELKDTRVQIRETGDGVEGSYSQTTNTITIGKDTRDKLRTLLHETQHAIQQIEGFTGGASTEYWLDRNAREQPELDERLDELRESARSIRDELDRQRKLTGYDEFVDQTYDQADRGDITEEEAEERIHQFEEEHAGLRSLENALDTVFKQMQDIRSKMRTAADLYRNTAGEIEARDVQHRQWMNETERRATAPNLGDENTVFADGVESNAEIKFPTYTEEDLKNNSLKLRQMNVVKNLSGNEFSDHSKTLRENVLDFFNSLGNNVYSEEFGDVALTPSSVRSEIRHGSTYEKIVAYAALPEVIQNGTVIHTIDKGFGLERIITAAPITIGTQKYYMAVMLQRDPTSQRLYAHDVVIAEEPTSSTGRHLNTNRAVRGGDKLFITDILQNALDVKSEESKTKNSARDENQISFDDITNGAMTRSNWNRNIRERAEEAEQLISDVKDYFRKMDPNDPDWLSADDIADEMDFNLYTSDMTAGDMAGASTIMEILQQRADRMSGQEREEAFLLMERILPHLSASVQQRYTGEGNNEDQAETAFSSWYSERHPSLYYPGYRPGDLFDRGNADFWQAQENQEEEIRYLQNLLDSGRLMEPELSQAREFLDRLNNPREGETFYSQREYVPDERDLVREYAARPTTKDEVLKKWSKKMQTADALRLKLQDLDRSIENIEVEVRKGNPAFTQEFLDKVRNTREITENKLRRAEKAIAGMERTENYKRAAAKMRSEWSDDPRETARLIRELRETNQQLEEYAEYWKRQGSITGEGEQKARRADVQRFAGELAEHANYRGDRAQLQEMLQNMADMIVSNNNGYGLNWESVQEQAQAIANELVNNSYSMIDPEADTRKALQQRLREMRIRPDEMWTSDIGDWESFRRRQFNKLTFSESGENIDDVYQQLNGEFGDGLFPPDITAGSDQVYQILAALDSLRAQQVFNFADSNQAAMAAAYYANRITETMLYGDIGEELTIADQNFRALGERLRKAEQEAREGKRTLEDLQKMQRFEMRAALQDQRKQMARREETAKVRRQIDKTGKRLIKYLTENNGKNPIPEPLKEAVGKVLLDLDLSGGMVEKQKKRYVRDMQEVAKIVMQQESYMSGQTDKWDGMFLDLPADTIQELNDHLASVQEAVDRAEERGRSWNPNMMNLEELNRLNDILTVLTSAITNSNEILSAARAGKISEKASQGIEYLKSLGTDKTRGEKGNAFHKFLRFQNTTPYYFFRKFGEPGLEMFKLIQDGWDKFAFNAKQVVEFAEKTYTAEEAREIQETVLEFNLRRRGDLSADLDHTEKVTMTKAQVMSLYCLWKRQQAQGHLAGAGIRIADYKRGNTTVTQAENYLLDLTDIAKIINTLTDRDKEIADALQKYMNTVGSDWGNEVSMKRFGIRSFTEENYFPIQTDDRNRQLRNPESDAANLYRLLNMSFTKNTVRNASNSIVLDNIFDVFSNHMADMAKYNGLGLPMLDAMKWFSFNQTSELNEEGQYGYESIQKQAEIAFGREARNYFTTFMQDLNGVREGGRGEDFASRVMSNYKVAAVAANLRVALLQPTSYFRAGAVLDPKYLAAGLRMSNKNGQAEAQQYSGTAVWKDLGFYDTNINAGLRDMIKHADGVKEKIQDVSMKGAEIGDKTTWGALWNACKAEQSAAGYQGEELMQHTAERFREVVYRTQVMDSTMTRSHMMRAKGAFAGMVTAFMSEPTLTWNMLLDAYGEYETQLRQGGNKSEAWQKSRKHIARAVVAHVSTAVLAALVESAVDAMRDDDRYADYWERFANALLGMDGNLMQDLIIHNKLPVIKDIFAIAGGDSVERMDMAGIQSTVKAFNIWKETIALGLELQDQATSVTYKGNMTPWGRIYQLLQATSRMSGLPIGNTLRDVVAIWNTTVAEFAPSMKIQTYNPGREQEIKYAVKDGYLTEDEAVNWLMRYELADDEIDARQKVFVWVNGKQFTRAINAMNAGDEEEFAAALDELEELRFKPSSIQTAVRNEIEERYIGREGEARISKETATEMLVQYGGMLQRKAEQLVEQWTSEVVTGIKYEDIDEAYVAGDISKDKAQAMLIQYGGRAPEDAAARVQQWTAEVETGIRYSEIGDMFYYGEISQNEATQMYEKYGGKTEDEALDSVMKVAFKRDFGYEMERIDIQTDYANGGYTHDQMKQILMDYRYSKTEKSAESTVTRWDFVGQDWSLDDISGYEAQRYYNYEVDAAGVSKHAWFDWLQTAKQQSAAGNLSGTPNGKGGYVAYSKVDKILALIDTLQLPPEQKDALFLAGWDSGSEGNPKNLNRAPWH